MKYSGKTFTKSIAIVAAVFSLQTNMALAAPADDAANKDAKEFSNALSSSTLDESRGAGTTVFNLSNMTASVDNNSVNGDLSSGTNSIANSFNNANGIITDIQNSGSFVSINQNTTVNINYCSTPGC